MSIDYCVHMSESYIEAEANPGLAGDRAKKTKHMVTHMGVSVISGAVSSLGSMFFLLVSGNYIFMKFGIFMFLTIGLSMIYALTLFPALMAMLGPVGEHGNVRKYVFEHSVQLQRVNAGQFDSVCSSARTAHPYGGALCMHVSQRNQGK